MNKATIVFLLLLIGCGNSYDQGYEDAWEERKNSLSYFMDKNYKQGFNEGAEDYWYHNRGCYEADNGDPLDAALASNSWYRQGYEDCS